MADIWSAAKQLACSQYVLTITVRYVAACDCTGCRSIRQRFEHRWARRQQEVHYAYRHP